MRLVCVTDVGLACVRIMVCSLRRMGGTGDGGQRNTSAGPVLSFHHAVPSYAHRKCLRATHSGTQKRKKGKRLRQQCVENSYICGHILVETLQTERNSIKKRNKQGDGAHRSGHCRYSTARAASTTAADGTAAKVNAGGCSRHGGRGSLSGEECNFCTPAVAVAAATAVVAAAETATTVAMPHGAVATAASQKRGWQQQRHRRRRHRERHHDGSQSGTPAVAVVKAAAVAGEMVVTPRRGRGRWAATVAAGATARAAAAGTRRATAAPAMKDAAKPLWRWPWRQRRQRRQRR